VFLSYFTRYQKSKVYRATGSLFSQHKSVRFGNFFGSSAVLTLASV
jgi:hypothetical protein